MSLALPDFPSVASGAATAPATAAKPMTRAAKTPESDGADRGEAEPEDSGTTATAGNTTARPAKPGSLRAILRHDWFILLPLLVNLATYLVTFPGVDSPDAADQREQYATWTFNKQHSVLDTFFLGFVARDRLWLANLLQVLVFSACIVVALAVLSRRVGRRALLVATLLWSFYPLFPAYSVACTKDVLCAGFTLLLCVEVFEAIDTKGRALLSPWFLAGLALTLFVTNELRKNNFIFVFAIIVFMLIRFRREYRRILASLLAFVALSAAWGAYCDYGLKASPSPTSEMLGVPLMQVGYIYYQDLHGSPQRLDPQADAYFTAIRPAQKWAGNYDVERLLVMSNKVPQMTGKDLGPFLSNWSKLCFANLGTCVAAYAKFEGSIVNPLQETDDQYTIAASLLHTNKYMAEQSRLGPVAHTVFNLALLDWAVVALAVLAWRRGMRELLPLFLIPLGIVLSLALAALAVQIRLMLGSIILIPFLGALVFGRKARARKTGKATKVVKVAELRQ